MFGILVAILVFVAVFLGIFTINLVLTDIFKGDRSKQLNQMESDLRVQLRERAKGMAKNENTSLHDLVHNESNHFSILDLIRRFKEMTAQAGLTVNPGKIWFFSLTINVSVAIGLFVLLQNFVLSGAFVLFGAIFPVLLIAHKRKKRQQKLAEQLPDAVDLMSRVLRAGQTSMQGINAVADEFKDPVGTEFGVCYEQQNLGLSIDVALQQMAQRTGLIEVKILVMAMMIQRQAGGNLAELLDKLASVMRQRFKLDGSIRSLTAEGRLQAMVLIVLPFGVWFLLYFINRTYAMKLFDHPTLVLTSIGMMVLGSLWIRKIINFDY